MQYVILLAILWTNFEILTGTEWRQDFDGVYYKLFNVPNSIPIDETLVFDEKVANSASSCSLYCWKSGSVSLYYRPSENTCFCNSDVDSRLNVDTPTDGASSDVIYGYISSSVQGFTNEDGRKFDVQPLKENCFVLYHHGYKTDAIYSVQPLGGSSVVNSFCKMDEILDVGADDCLQWLEQGYVEDGVYPVRLSNGTSIDVWCDQQGGGWTVFQHRQDNTVDFTRGWTEYVDGFGDVSGNFWLGLEAIYLLTNQPSSLRIDMETFGDVSPPTAYALYTGFVLQPSTDNYRLSVEEFSGDCGDGLAFHNGMQFSTYDNDNDGHQSNVALSYKAGWWYSAGHRSQLNGVYEGGYYYTSYATGISWYPCWGWAYSLKTCSIKMRRN